ncbi:MAG TPA: gas vesicle protein [Vicinamibacterales bacterium]
MKRRPKRLPSTVPAGKPPKRPATSKPRPAASARARVTKPGPPRTVRRRPPPKRAAAQIIDDGEKSLVDVLDSLLNQGVVLNADLVLALADVDLVYVRLSALLCAADRLLPRERA